MATDQENDFLRSLLPGLHRLLRPLVCPGVDLDDLVQVALMECWRSYRSPRWDLRERDPGQFLRFAGRGIRLAVHREIRTRCRLRVSGRGRTARGSRSRSRADRTIGMVPEDFDFAEVSDPWSSVDDADEADFLLKGRSGKGIELLKLVTGIDPRGPMMQQDAAPLVGLKPSNAQKYLSRVLRDLGQDVNIP